MRFEECIEINDQNDEGQLRQKFLDQIDRIYKSDKIRGQKPIKVNVITFSGHGFTVNGDTIAVIPEMLEGSDIKVARFVNISGVARKLC